MKRWLVMAAAALALAGCGEQVRQEIADESFTPRERNRPFRVVATTQMAGDLVRQIAGDKVELTVLMGPGVDPHLYKARAGDVARISEADLIVYNGLHLEASMAELFEKQGAKAFAVGGSVPKDLLLQADGAHDPHIWFDVALWADTVPGLAETLAVQDGRHAPFYRTNGEKYSGELKALDEEVRRHIATIPENARVLITAHDAFHYFGRAYDIEVRGLQGISTASEPGAADVEELAALIAERRIPALFVESSVPARSIEAVRNAVKAKGFEVALGGQLFSDAMGDDGTPEGTYVGMVRHNVATIVKALGGTMEDEATTGTAAAATQGTEGEIASTTGAAATTP